MRKLLVVTFAMALLIGCSSEPEKKPAEVKKAPPKNEIVTGRVALQKMIAPAHFWSPDVRPFRLESTPTKEAAGADGKAGVWKAFFGSVARGTEKPFVWSGLTADDAPSPGTQTAGGEDTWSASNASAYPFDLAYLKVDSDKAYEVAQKHGGEAIMKKHADQTVHYVLSWSTAVNKLIWEVDYGEGPDLSVLVDASTGEFLRVKH